MFETVVPSVLDQWDNVPQEWQLPLLILTSATACLILAFGVFKITSKAPSSSSTEPIKEITSTETQVTSNDSDESIDDDQQEVTASENDDADPSSPPKLVSNSPIKLKESVSTPKKSMDNDISSPTTPPTTTSSELPLNVPSDEMDDENDTDASSSPSPSPSTPTKTPIKTPTKRSSRLANKTFGSIATPVGRRSARIARKATQ